jgi:hypothetical protein
VGRGGWPQSTAARMIAPIQALPRESSRGRSSSSTGDDILLNDWPHPPPFYLQVDGRLFALQPSSTYLVTGYGAALPNWIVTEEEEGRLTVLAEREDRYLIYSHDTLATDDDEDEGDDAEVADEAAAAE